MKQGDKLSGYEGFESVIFEEHGSYCCISTSDWCSLSSWNFIPFIIQLMFPFLSPVPAHGSCEAGDCLFLKTHQSAPLQAQERVSGHSSASGGRCTEPATLAGFSHISLKA